MLWTILAQALPPEFPPPDPGLGAFPTTPWAVAQWGALGAIVLGLAWEVLRCRKELADTLSAQTTERTRMRERLEDAHKAHAAELREARSAHAAELREMRSAIEAERSARLTEAKEHARSGHELAAQMNQVLAALDRARQRGNGNP